MKIIQLSLRTVSLGTGTKGKLQSIEAEATNDEGSPIKGMLATLKISVHPVASLRDFEITLPVAYVEGWFSPGHINGLYLEENTESEGEEK